MDLSTLMTLIQSGDKAAFQALYQHYSRMVYHIAYAQCADNDTSLEVVRRVFSRVYSALCKAPYNGDFCVWLTSLATEELKTVYAERKQAECERIMRGKRAAEAQLEAQAAQAERDADSVLKAQTESAPQTGPGSVVAAVFDAPAPAADTPLYTPESGQKREKAGGLAVFGVIFLILLAAILLWALAGLLMSLDIIPGVDLGYQWFNSHFFGLF